MTKMPDHLFVSYDGGLYDTRQPNCYKHALRDNYRYHHSRIGSVADLKATLRAGPYAWPGGYPLYFLTHDGAALSYRAVEDNLRDEFDAIAGGYSGRIIACLINWEDDDLWCEQTGLRIPSAYGTVE